MRKKGGAPLRKMASVMLDGKEKIMTIDSIKRYTVSGDIAYPIHEDPEGDFVTYEDHVAAIEADRKRRGEPVAWQFYDGGRWWNGDDRIKDHRKNTESAGYKTRDLYTAQQPTEPDEERLAMEAVMESVDPATWPGLTPSQRCALSRFAKPQPAEPVKVPSDDLVTRLRALARYEHDDDVSVADEAADALMSGQPAASAEPLLFAINYVLKSFKESEKAGYHTSDRAFAISILEDGLQKYHSAPGTASADPGRDRAARESK